MLICLKTYLYLELYEGKPFGREEHIPLLNAAGDYFLMLSFVESFRSALS